MNCPSLALRRCLALGLLAFLVAASAGAAAESETRDLQTIRSRVMAPLLTAPDATAVDKLTDSLQADGTWADIDYTDASRSAWSVPEHLNRLQTLARAYRAPQSALHGDGKVLSAAKRGLDGWLQLDPQNPNWWWNEIGVPRTLLPVLLLLDDELSDAQRAGGLQILRRAKISMTGQNLVWVTEITAGRGLLERDAALVATAYRRIADEIYLGLGEGIQPDFSFHQHGPCLYSHGYGAGFIVDCSRIAAQVAGTDLAFPADKLELLAGLILDGTRWMTRGSATDFGAEGREITRKQQSAGHVAAAANHMLQQATGREAEFRAAAAAAAGRHDAPPLTGNRHFWRSDLMTHHRPAYYASARMHSTRVANTDGPANSEGLLSHHLADGCMVLMRTGREYEDLFGVWDWQKIPGTTVRIEPAWKGSPRRMGTTEFVGGVSDGTCGLAACDFERDGLTAKKSWFFFDREIVCLGAGITCESDLPVVTTLNQCHLTGDVFSATGGEPTRLERGRHTSEPIQSEAIQWLWHDSVAYVSLEPAKLQIENGPRSGSWHASNRRYPPQEETRDLFTAWIDHGTNPRAADYAYVVVPEIAAERVADYVAENPVRVLANHGQVQAVVHKPSGLVAAAFYRPGEIAIRPHVTLAVDAACLLLVREQENQLQVTVSNPENKAAEIRLVLTSERAVHRVAVPLPGGLMAGSSVTRKTSR